MRTRTKHGQFGVNPPIGQLAGFGKYLKNWRKNGEPCEIRTRDPLLKRQMLYRLS
jgi:hypothetical protein